MSTALWVSRGCGVFTAVTRTAAPSPTRSARAAGRSCASRPAAGGTGLLVHDRRRRVSPAGMAFLDAMAQEVKKNPPPPVPKRAKPVAEEPKKAEGRKEGKKKGGEKAAEGTGAFGSAALFTSSWAWRRERPCHGRGSVQPSTAALLVLLPPSSTQEVIGLNIPALRRPGEGWRETATLGHVVGMVVACCHIHCL